MPTLPADLSIRIAEDRTAAWLIAQPSALKRSWDAEELKALIASANLKPAEAAFANAEKLLQLSHRKPGQDKIELLKATLPRHGEPAQLLIDGDAGPLVQAGAALGRRQPPVPPQDGLDVLGQPMPARACSDPEPPRVGLTVGEDDVITAACDGLLLTVGPHPRVEAATIFETAPAETTTKVAGNAAFLVTIRRNTVLQTEGFAYFKDTIEPCDIRTGGDLIARGGVCGEQVGTATVGGNLFGSYIRQSTATVAGDVVIDLEMINAVIQAGGAIRMPKATALATQLSCMRGIEIGTVGSHAGVKTTIEIGLDRNIAKVVDQLAPAIDAQRKRVKEIRMTIQPLMKNQRNLTPAQKEKATELLYEADEMEAKVNRLVEQLKSKVVGLRSKIVPELRVNAVLHPGTVLRFPGIETTIRTAMHGPLTIKAMYDAPLPAMVVTFDSGHAHPLECRQLPDDGLLRAEKLVA